MEFRKAVLLGVVTLVVLLCLAEFTSAQTGVCYQSLSRRTGRTAYRPAYRYSYYRCGWWGWRRCGRRTSYSQRYTRYSTVYYSQFGCCGGYSQSGSRCIPICSPGCRNGGSCTAPNRCSCPATWTGSYCQTDVNECARDTDNCQQVCVNTNGGYRCACNTGYSLNSDGRTCGDINECSSNGGRGPCAHSCTNTPGSFTCSCRTGYALASDGRGCNDINECTNGQALCQQNCQNTPGSYTCSCRTGYSLDSNGLTCSDINECTSGTHQCAHNCQNIVGSYTCSCRTGYRLASNGRSCFDIDECAEGIHQCAQNCHNNPGSYTCSCDAGYSLDANGLGCSDIDECAAGTDGCAQNCANTIGSYTCSCNTGYRLNADRHGCDDIDECAEDTDRCVHNCHNNVGSYTCSCNIGFRLNSNGYGCDDIDECTEGTDRCAQNCHNNVGSYTCTCNTGYRLNANGYGCDDIDECAEDSDGCAQNCHNSVGSYTCSCNAGYRLNPDGRACDDIDECAEGTDRCAQNCHNTIGSYTCSCNIGYRLNSNGYGCDDINECLEQTDECQHICNNTIGSYVCDCRIGYALNADGRTCSDIDECALGTDRCDQNCHNNIGSYTCSCNTGWRLDFDGFRCNDINECLSGAIGNTTCHQVCVNTPGSYNCDCLLGYRLRPNMIDCMDIDECTDTQLVHQCDHTCINTIGSYACTCDSGYTLNNDGLTCDDQNECADMTSNCDQTCVNTPGSFTCNCTMGYQLAPNGYTCNDVDECALMIHLCEQNCMNSPGSFTCSCNVNSTKTNDGLSCLSAPENILLSVQGPRELEMIWSTPRNDSRDGYFENFQVICVTGTDRNIVYTNLIEDRHAAGDVIMQGVTPYTGYNCCVLMTTSEGSSPYSCAAATTDQDTPGGPPNAIDISFDSPYNVSVSWAIPQAANGIITRYTLYVDYKNGSIVPVNLNPSVNDYVITGLTPYQSIGVSLSASTSIGTGPNSTVVSGTTEQTPPSEILQPTIQTSGDNAATITWNKPEHENGILTYYKVTVFNQLRNYSVVITLPPNATKSLEFNNLVPEVPYTFEVVAATEAGESVPFVQAIFTREGIPSVPKITALARVTGTEGVLTWQPYTLDTSKGFLTKVEVAYQKALTTARICPPVDSAKVITVNVSQSAYRIFNLIPEEEYCIAIRAWTSAGSSEFSTQQILPLSEPSLFQVRFQLPPGVFCTDYVTRSPGTKVADIEEAIAMYILDNCNCNIFSDQYIAQALLTCGKNLREFIFQANILSTPEKTSLEFRDELVQKWVNQRPIVPIAGESYQVDPYCSVELTGLGSTYCYSENPTVGLSQQNGTRTAYQIAIYVTSSVGGAIFVCILIAVAAGIACCCCSRKSVRKQYREPRQEELNIQDPSRNKDLSTVSRAVPEQPAAYLVRATNDLPHGTLSRGTLKRDSRVVDNFKPTYGPNENTVRRMAKEKEAKHEKPQMSTVSPTYIDDEFDDEFEDY